MLSRLALQAEWSISPGAAGCTAITVTTAPGATSTSPRAAREVYLDPGPVKPDNDSALARGVRDHSPVPVTPGSAATCECGNSSSNPARANASTACGVTSCADNTSTWWSATHWTTASAFTCPKVILSDATVNSPPSSGGLSA